MAFVHGKSIFVLLNGYNITGFLNKIDAPYTADTAETSTFGSENKSYIPGMKDATMSAEGLFDGDAGKIDETLHTILAGTNTGNNMIWFPAGNTLGNVGYGLYMVQTAYSVMGTKDDAVKISMAGHSSVGRERVKLVLALAALAVDGSGTVNDNGSSSANGGSAYLQVTAASGFSGNVTVKLEHSSDNFAADTTDLAVFTNVTGITHERVAITGTIKQYVRATYDLNGGTATMAIALCRK